LKDIRLVFMGRGGDTPGLRALRKLLQENPD
jgi:hypothetical protein